MSNLVFTMASKILHEVQGAEFLVSDAPSPSLDLAIECVKNAWDGQKSDEDWFQNAKWDFEDITAVKLFDEDE